MARDGFVKRRFSRDPYWNLGAEIIISAIKANDVIFLKSDWCAELESLMGMTVTAYEIWYKRRFGKWPPSYKK